MILLKYVCVNPRLKYVHSLVKTWVRRIDKGTLGASEFIQAFFQ